MGIPDPSIFVWGGRSFFKIAKSAGVPCYSPGADIIVVDQKIASCVIDFIPMPDSTRLLKLNAKPVIVNSVRTGSYTYCVMVKVDTQRVNTG